MSEKLFRLGQFFVSAVFRLQRGPLGKGAVGVVRVVVVVVMTARMTNTLRILHRFPSLGGFLFKLQQEPVSCGSLFHLSTYSWAKCTLTISGFSGSCYI